MTRTRTRELTLLKALLWIYIILCFILAGLNYGYVKAAPESVGKAITWFWHFYENWIKTGFITIASVLTLRIINKSGRSTMRKRNLTGFILAALVVHIFAPAFPLIGNKKKIQPKTVRLLMTLKWLMFAMALLFSGYWILLLSGALTLENYNLISKIEIYKYLSAELLMMMFFWIVFVGRGYCYYCPMGTVLGFISKLSGQKIMTNLTKCINCGQCNSACPMAIELQSNASKGEPVTSLRCVGCGHCVDACITKNLSYTTTFLSKFASKR